MSHWVNCGDSFICSYIQGGMWKLATLPWMGDLKEFDLPFTEIGGVCANQDKIFFVGASPTQPAALVELDRGTRECSVIRRSNGENIDLDFVSQPELVKTFLEDGTPVYGWFYPPKNSNFVAAESERPPLYVEVHGGPEFSASTAYDPSVQFWTTRGVAVLEIDYPGSTRYGRAYRDALIGKWGEIDRDACRMLALDLARLGFVDPRCMVIGGCSAGGYTALNEMASGHVVFIAAIAYASIANLFDLAKDTGGFEGGNLATLVGDPRDVDLWKARSPFYQRHRITKPVLFMHGQDDFVTPMGQIAAMVGALVEQGVPVATFFPEGEQHGFRKGENITRATEAQLAFMAKVCGFTPADDLTDALENFNVEDVPVVDSI